MSEPTATYEIAPAIETLDLVSKLRKILPKPNSGIEAAQLIEAFIAEIVESHLEK